MQTLPGWKMLEQETGCPLLVASGLLSFGERVGELFSAMEEGARRLR